MHHGTLDFVSATPMTCKEPDGKLSTDMMRLSAARNMEGGGAEGQMGCKPLSSVHTWEVMWSRSSVKISWSVRKVRRSAGA